MKILSKSSFVRGLKCPKALFLHIFQPENRDETSESQQNIFNIGHNAGELSQQLFPGGIDASRGEPGEVQAALQYTRELIEQGQEVIYEAAFSDGETLCYMDILVKKDGLWSAYEVKASTQLKDYHIMDVSFQHYVITNSGLPLSGIYLVHINNQYIRRGELDIWQLFTFEDLTSIAENNRLQIAEQLLKLQQMIEAGIMPEIETGSHCDNPYPCDFAGSCHQDEPYFLLSDVKGIQGHKALALHNLGIITFEDIPDNFPFTDREWQLAESEMDQKEIRIADALENFKARLEYPLYFMDFETIMPAIPQYNENRPYQQIPFQFSLHVQDLPGAPVSHFEFLGVPPEDPRPRFISELLWCISNKGSIVVYNQAFEQSRLREIARDLPSYAEQINQLFDRMVDLMGPFRSRQLYHPAMKGSYSIKKVLPALVPELSYNDLEISEGGTASLTYMSLYEDQDPESVQLKRENLLKYCKLDTLAMVKLLEKM
ncbi:MAG: DUF2779 domain-containing protein [Bacteroidales bacterium]|nr:DUF2779 domain-containing protein [Bacteroidales bacterium]